MGWPHSLPRLVLAPGFVLVAELHARIVGFAHGGPESQGRAIGEIYGFYTHPHTWGSGTAMALMKEACSLLAPDFDAVVVWTMRDAAQARRFYEKAGFRLTGEEKAQSLTDWVSGEGVDRPSVEFIKPLESSA